MFYEIQTHWVLEEHMRLAWSNVVKANVTHARARARANRKLALLKKCFLPSISPPINRRMHLYEKRTQNSSPTLCETKTALWFFGVYLPFRKWIHWHANSGDVITPHVDLPFPLGPLLVVEATHTARCVEVHSRPVHDSWTYVCQVCSFPLKQQSFV
jgi:hypothetical protein